MFLEMMFKNPHRAGFILITVIVSIVLHELAHGWVAIWQGDRTPIEKGHMTANPIVHMGWFSIILLLIYATTSWFGHRAARSMSNSRAAPSWFRAF